MAEIKARGRYPKMNLNRITTKETRDQHFFLALHSCSTTLGVAVLNSKTPEKICSSIYPIGRNLSNSLLTCISKVLPTSYWNDITRISVAIGPGGFTGTRLTVVLARTLAQQLNCQLDGISSFALMAPRLVKKIEKSNLENAFWITKTLPRRGIVGGKYHIKYNSKVSDLEEVLELKKPHLLEQNIDKLNSVSASDDVKTDIIRLLKLSFLEESIGRKSPWQKVLPIYPTSPVA